MMYLNGSTHTHTHVEKIIRLVSARLHSNEPVLKGRRMTAKFQKPGASKGDHLSRCDVCPRDKNVINFVPAEAREKKQRNTVLIVWSALTGSGGWRWQR